MAHHLLLGIWFREVGKPLHFLVEEFYLITGLKGQEPNEVVVPDDDSWILAYFSNMGDILS